MLLEEKIMVPVLPTSRIKMQIKRRGIHLLTNNGRIQITDICNIRFVHTLMFPHKFPKKTCYPASINKFNKFSLLQKKIPVFVSHTFEARTLTTCSSHPNRNPGLGFWSLRGRQDSRRVLIESAWLKCPLGLGAHGHGRV